MSHFKSHRFANKALVLTCLLALTVLLAGSVQGYNAALEQQHPEPGFVG